MKTPRLLDLELQKNSTTDIKKAIDISLDMVAEYRMFDNDAALNLAKETRKIAIQEDYLKGIGRSAYSIGMCYWQIGDYDLGIIELQGGLKLSKQLKDKRLEAKCLNILGNIYRDIGDISNALKNYLSALDIFEKENDEHTSGVVMKNIANLHFDLFDYDNALEYALRSVNILEKFENKNRIVSVYYTLGNIYFKKDDYKLAISFYYNCLELTEKNTSGHALATCGIGKVYFMQGDYTKAKNYLQHAYQLGKGNSFFESYIISCFYLGRIALEQNNNEEALSQFNEAIDTANEHNRKHDSMSVHEWLAIVYENLGNIIEAYKNLKAFEKIKSEIFQFDAVQRLRNLQVQHEIAFARKDKEVAERTASLKQQFLANMSHEIRTPMNAIVGMSRLLKNKEHLPHQEKYLNAIQASADNLLVIINDILDLSKLEAGKIDIEKINFSLREAITNMHEMMRIKAQEKGLKFEYQIENNIEDILIGDPTRLTQILINLIGNAIKFTENGNVNLNVVCKKTNDQNILLRFDISDTGIGISEGFINNLFEKFTQAGSDTARKYGGTGLGLSICKQLIDLLGGSVQVKSKLGEGTTFKVEIPFEIAKEQSLQNTQSFVVNERHKGILNQLSILLVEDNEFNQILAVDTLKELAPNIKIDIAINGKIATEKAQNKLYDLILMDIQMPEMNGVQATQHIRSLFRPPFNEVKIIAMTANVLKEDIKIYLNAGMDEYVSKPFNTEVLVYKMIKLLNNKFDNNSILEHAVSETIEIVSPSILEPKSVIDLGFLNEFTRGDFAKQKKYIELFLQNAPKILAQAYTAIAAKDYNTLKVSVHGLKSQLNYMGVKEEVSRVFELEKACEDATKYDQLEPMLQNLNAVCQQSFTELAGKIQ